MIKINIQKAKTHFSKCIVQVQAGKTIILCKNNVPVALITPLPKEKRSKKKLFGLAKGMGKVLDSFFDELTDKELPGFSFSPFTKSCSGSGRSSLSSQRSL
jgi:antitoxin (DNA-binding transcriptional repressor) of toxin-antitoxin stability system